MLQSALRAFERHDRARNGAVTKFCLSCNYVIPSEVEESLDVNPIMGRDYNFSDLRRHKQEPLCFIHWGDETVSHGELGSIVKEIGQGLLPITDARNLFITNGIVTFATRLHERVN